MRGSLANPCLALPHPLADWPAQPLQKRSRDETHPEMSYGRHDQGEPPEDGRRSSDHRTRINLPREGIQAGANFQSEGCIIVSKNRLPHSFSWRAQIEI